MNVSKGLSVCLAVLFITGCADPPPPKKTVFDPMTQQLDRARDVQSTIDRNAEQTRSAVDGQERGDGQEPGDGQNRGDSRP